MYNLFWFVMDAAFAAGWAAALLMLFRFLGRRWLPKWLAAALWIVVAVRLVCPISWQADISIMPEPLSQTVQSYTASSTVEAVPQTSVPTAPTPTVSLETVAMTVWGVGVAAMLLYMLLSYRRLRRRVRAATKRDEAIFECETVASPFILGVIHPRIYLPYGMSEEQRINTLAHERAHIARGDHLWKPLAFLLLSVYWFHPLLWLAYLLFCRDIEFACDEKVIRRLSAEDRKGYSRALLSVAVCRRELMCCPLAFGEVGVEARVKGIKRYRKPALIVVAVSAVLCLLVAGWMVIDPTAPAQTTLDGAHVAIDLSNPSRSETDSLLAKEGNRLRLRSEGEDTILFRVDEADAETMRVVLVTDKTVYHNGADVTRIEVDAWTPCRVYTQPHEQGSRIDVGLVLPSSVRQPSGKTEHKTVLRTDGASLELHDHYFRFQFDQTPEPAVCGQYKQTDDTLTLTQDGHLIEWVFRKRADDTWMFDEAASYRHKKAQTPKLANGAVLRCTYAYTIEKSNQQYLFTLTDGVGGELLSGYSANLVKPTFHEMGEAQLKVTVYTPAAAPKMHRYLVDLATGAVTKEDES